MLDVTSLSTLALFEGIYVLYKTFNVFSDRSFTGSLDPLRQTGKHQNVCFFSDNKIYFLVVFDSCHKRNKNDIINNVKRS